MYSNNYSSGKKSYSSRPQHSSNGGRSGGSRSGGRSGGGRGGRSGGPRGQYINPTRFVNHDATEQTTVVYTPKHAFSEFGLVDALVQNIVELGYETPSAIQDQTIELAVQGKDIVGLANTGTGKTAAFLLPILNSLYTTRATNSVLIMAPTRELAQQIDEEFKRFSRGMKLFSAVCVGGSPIGRQIRDLQRRPHVIIGTPGRLKDLIQRKQLYLYDVTTLVLDEADRMLDMGFVKDIRDIASELPLEHQTLCFSATITSAVERIVQEFMNSPTTVSVRVGETADHIFQDVVRFTSSDHKREVLGNMLTDAEFEKVIVFGETKFGVQRLADSLTKEGITAVAIHGNKSQSQRERALKQFKSEQVKVLVATDVAARGLDIPNVSHVINFDIPQSYEDYVHRIGRTGRAGKAGKAYTFIQAR